MALHCLRRPHIQCRRFTRRYMVVSLPICQPFLEVHQIAQSLARRRFIGRLLTLVVFGLVTVNIVITSMVTVISAKNYPGGKVMQRLHQTSSARNGEYCSSCDRRLHSMPLQPLCTSTITRHRQVHHCSCIAIRLHIIGHSPINNGQISNGNTTSRPLVWKN